MEAPQNEGFIWENPNLKWMIWGYPHLWNPPCHLVWQTHTHPQVATSQSLSATMQWRPGPEAFAIPAWCNAQVAPSGDSWSGGRLYLAGIVWDLQGFNMNYNIYIYIYNLTGFMGRIRQPRNASNRWKARNHEVKIFYQQPGKSGLPVWRPVL